MNKSVSTMAPTVAPMYAGDLRTKPSTDDHPSATDYKSSSLENPDTPVRSILKSQAWQPSGDSAQSKGMAKEFGESERQRMWAGGDGSVRKSGSFEEAETSLLILNKTREAENQKEPRYAGPQKGSHELANPPIACVGEDLKEFSMAESTSPGNTDSKDRQLFEEKVNTENVTQRRFSWRGE